MRQRTSKHVSNALTNQDYPQKLVEVIVVDDRSTDVTGEIVTVFTNKYPWLKLIQIKEPPDYSSAKKWALAQGIASASYDILLFTDADCIPPPSWISTLVQCFDEHVGMVVGFSPVRLLMGGLWNLILGLDGMAAGLVAAGTIGLGAASMCTGRNLAYRRKVYDEVGGFEASANSVSGDDDLFLQRVKKHTSWKIAYSLSKMSVVPANGAAGLGEFIRQKRRHLSAGRYYGFKQQIVYGLWHLANIAIWMFPLFARFVHPSLIICLIVKILLDFLVLFTFAQQFRLTRLLWGLPFWEVFFVLYHILIGPLSLVGKVRWKE